MKKHAFWTYLGRGLIALICILIISFIGIFSFDRYKGVSANNKDKDTYWSKLEGFKTYDDLKANENKYNITSTEYVSPFYHEDGTEMTPAEKVETARYEEELDYVVKSIKDRITTLKNNIRNASNVYTGTKADWIFAEMSVNYLLRPAQSLYDAVTSLGYSGTEDELINVILNYNTLNVYNQILAKGYSSSFSSFVADLANASGTGSDSMYEKAVQNGYVPTSSDEATARKNWVIEVAGFNKYTKSTKFSAYDFIKSNGYKGTKEEWLKLVTALDGAIYYTIIDEGYVEQIGSIVNDYHLFMAIYNDCGKFDELGNNTLASAYDYSTKVDQGKIDVYQNELDKLQDLINVASSKQLVKWSEYANRYQLMMKKGNFEFYMNLSLTTFKVVDTRTGYEWYSNPQTPDSINLTKQQSTIISVFYGETGGALTEFSNYTYSTSTDENGNSVKPNFAIKFDEENNTIQVWYHMEKRSIDYTSIPKYFSVERANELLANNKEIAASGKIDSAGNRVIDLEATLDYDTDAINARITQIKQELDGSISEADKAKLQEELRTLEQQLVDYRKAYDIWGKVFETNGSWYNKMSGSVEGNLKTYDYYEYKGGGTKYEFMSSIVLKELYRLFYEWLGYTTADLAEDNSEFDMEIDLTRVAFEVAIEYKLTDKGLTVTVPNDSINEIGSHVVCNIDILPYFTATKSGVGGYTLIPDGSGSILEHDNGKANIYEPYIKRLYTTDLAQTSVVKRAESYDIMLPMYAVVNNTSAVIADVENNAAQLELRATTSGYGQVGETHNRNYFRVYTRESQDVYIGTYSKEAVRKFTNQSITDDTVINFVFLANTTGENLKYSDVAKAYREILINRYDIEEKDTTDSPVLDMDVVGAYTYTDNFLGFSYNAKGTMTTYEELSKILDTYLGVGVEYINVFYKGWRKEALVNTSFKRIKLNTLLGSKKQLKALVSKNDNVTIYPYVSMGELHKYQESYGGNHYTTRDVIGEIITNAPYDLNTNTYGMGRKISVLSPHYYQAFSQSLVDAYIKVFGIEKANKNNIGINSISIDKFGSALAGDYKKNNEMFKVDAVRQQIESLKLINEKIQNINLYQPYDYAIPYISHARDIPYQASRKELLDYSVPFYQLVVNGLFDYSGESINEKIESGETYHIMKLIETGSNPQFTFTYDSSKKLIQTDYNNYYNTEYSNWVDTVSDIYQQLNGLHIYECRLVSHERLEPNVYLVTYSNGFNEIKIVLNYSFATYNYLGTNIAAKSYKLV